MIYLEYVKFGENMKSYINQQHRYYTLDYYYKEKYNSKIFKVALNGNFTCPNRDGKISYNGCIFCSASGSGDFAGDKELPLNEQFNQIKTILLKKWPNAKYIPYFQANTNTYGPIEKIKSLFDEAITLDPNIVAIAIATRPDCINDETLEYLDNLNKKIPVTIELGLQTIHDKTAKIINRGYKLSVFEDCVNKLKSKNIEIVVHIINGLPFETNEMMIDTIKYLNKLKINGIKIHSLFVLKDTVLEKMYLNNEFKIQSFEEYVNITCEQLAYIDEDIVIHRINGDPPKNLLVAPEWCLKKFVVMNEIDKLMKIKNYFQGCKNKENR